MSEWWSYGLRDLLPFSPQIYYRQFELFNAEWWPLPLLTLAGGIAMLLLSLHRPASIRPVLAILAVCWLWPAWAFHWQRYAAIHLAGGHFAVGFAIEALLLPGLAFWHGRPHAETVSKLQRHTGIGLCAFALLVYPWLGLLQGRSLAQAEIFGMAPDPTVLATLGFLLMAGRGFWLLAPIPLAWCAVSGATLWAMQAADFFILPLGALLAIGTMAVQNRSAPHR